MPKHTVNERHGVSAVTNGFGTQAKNLSPGNCPSTPMNASTASAAKRRPLPTVPTATDTTITRNARTQEEERCTHHCVLQPVQGRHRAPKNAQRPSPRHDESKRPKGFGKKRAEKDLLEYSNVPKAVASSPYQPKIRTWYDIFNVTINAIGKIVPGGPYVDTSQQDRMPVHSKSVPP